MAAGVNDARMSQTLVDITMIGNGFLVSGRLSSRSGAVKMNLNKGVLGKTLRISRWLKALDCISNIVRSMSPRVRDNRIMPYRDVGPIAKFLLWNIFATEEGSSKGTDRY